MIDKRNFLERFKGKIPFIYEDPNGLIAVGYGGVTRINDSYCYIRYEEYKKINKDDDVDKNKTKEIMNDLHKMSGRELLKYKDENVNIIFNGNCIRAEDYINKLTEKDKENLMNQLIKFTNLYMECFKDQ